MARAAAVVSQPWPPSSPSWSRSRATGSPFCSFSASIAPVKVSLPAVANTTHKIPTARAAAPKRRLIVVFPPCFNGVSPFLLCSQIMLVRGKKNGCAGFFFVV